MKFKKGSKLVHGIVFAVSGSSDVFFLDFANLAEGPKLLGGSIAPLFGSSKSNTKWHQQGLFYLYYFFNPASRLFAYGKIGIILSMLKGGEEELIPTYVFNSVNGHFATYPYCTRSNTSLLFNKCLTSVVVEKIRCGP